MISPCASTRFQSYRNWPWERFADVIRHLADAHGASVILTGGPTEIEREYGEKIAAAVSVTNLIGETSLKELLAIIAGADLLICPDSGPGHMGTAVGTPVIGLFATTNPERAAPYLSRDLVVNRYPDAIRERFGKSVSEVRWGERVRDAGAMKLISVADVTARIDQVLGNPSRH